MQMVRGYSEEEHETHRLNQSGSEALTTERKYYEHGNSTCE